MLGVERLDGVTFLDAGSGSGLSSLAARRLGARVHSFDYDTKSVASTQALRDRYSPGDPAWNVERGSVLDRDYLRGLGTFDVVYSWGVLHHTGAMWNALDNMVPLVRPGGTLFVAIYNDQGVVSRIWRRVKQAYNILPAPLRFLVVIPSAVVAWGPATIRDFLKLRPFAWWRRYRRSRGMSPTHDLIDWVGGYPFEVATPQAIVDRYAGRGFLLRKIKTCGGRMGCNEFVFTLSDVGTAARAEQPI
jgi:2-polyprenyl-6-hydroxyphenyl methylase/3-demethylubiquinone-9 3-methyltransferase